MYMYYILLYSNISFIYKEEETLLCLAFPNPLSSNCSL